MRWYPTSQPEWRRWFAWYPVQVYFNGAWGTVWWEWVELRDWSCGDWLISDCRLIEEDQ